MELCLLLKTRDFARHLVEKKKIVYLSNPECTVRRQDHDHIRQKILSIYYTGLENMGFSKDTLYYKNAGTVLATMPLVAGGQSFYAYRILISDTKAYSSIETDFGTKTTVLCIKVKGIMRCYDALKGPPVSNSTLFPSISPCVGSWELLRGFQGTLWYNLGNWESCFTSFTVHRRRAKWRHRMPIHSFIHLLCPI